MSDARLNILATVLSDGLPAVEPVLQIPAAIASLVPLWAGGSGMVLGLELLAALITELFMAPGLVL